MANESINKPHDPIEVRFLRCEQEVVDINYNVNLLMMDLRNKLGIF